MTFPWLWARLILAASLSSLVANGATPELVFHAPFDNCAEAVIEGGKRISPSETGGTVPFESAAKNQGVRVEDTDLTYDVGELLGDEGAILFWVKPKALVEETLSLQTADAKRVMLCQAWASGFGVNIFDPNSNSIHHQPLFLRGSPYLFRVDDLYHFAVTWDKTGAVRIFRNGMPYLPGGSAQPPPLFHPKNFDLSVIRKIVVSRKSKSVVDDLKIFRGHISPADVYAAYREVSPLDVTAPVSVIQSEENAEIVLKVAPGGYYTRPVHGDQPYFEAEGQLDLTLYSMKGWHVSVDEVYPSNINKNAVLDETEIQKLTTAVKVGQTPVNVTFPSGKLPEGRYRILWKFTASSGVVSQKSVFIEVADIPSGEIATSDDIELGDVVFHKAFTSAEDPALLREGKLRAVDGKYLELGNNNGDRISTVVSNLQDYIQKPMILEVTWPDDQQRMMGLYVHNEAGYGVGLRSRDSLQGGIQAGREIPSSGEMVRTQYLFYPQAPSFLFEARTMANDFPAAIAELRLYEIKGDKLPKLKINFPTGMDHRRIGNNDEDQTLQTNMAQQYLKGLAGRILDYMDYTGQDTFHYSILRYYFSFFPSPGSWGTSLYPHIPGAMGYLIDAMNARGKEFTAMLNIGNLPETYYASVLDRDLSKTGMVMLDRNLRMADSFCGVKGTPNIAHPSIRAAYVRYVEDFEEDLKKPGMKAVSFWDTMGWANLDRGYDEYTVDKFSTETGIKVPSSNRYEFLTSEKMLPEWSKWRAGQIYELIKAVRQALDRINPDLKLLVMRRGEYDWDSDLDAMLKPLPRTYACDFRRPTNYRLDFHWNRPESDREETMYDFKEVRKLHQERKSNECVSLFYIYYETYTKSMDTENYPCGFQSADIKPHGRHFLKELAFNVAAGDVLEIAMGGQPFGSFGRDAETREFARAFAALPRQSFNTVENPNHSVVVRYLLTKNGTYVYVVSGVWSDAEAILDWPDDLEYLDLSSNQKRTGKTIELKPYELRSFLVPNREIEIRSFAQNFSPELKAFYLKRMGELETAVKTFELNNLPVAEETARLAEIRQALTSENYAETHRLAWSVSMNELMRKLKTLALEVEQARMIEKNRFALNCGSRDYYRAPDGRLFFPDHIFSDSARYGYQGSWSSAVRNTDGLKNETEPGLFQTEAWNVDGYKFVVPNGRYCVRLYMKIAWAADFKADTVVFSVYANGQPLFTDLDLYKTQAGDYNQPFIKDFHVDVDNGLLVLKIKAGKGLGKNIQLCNAIEVIPEA